MRAGDDGFPRHPNLTPVTGFNVALEGNGIGCLGAGKFPRMGLFQPIFGCFHLTTSLKPLPKQAMFIANSVTIGGTAKGGHAFHETRSKPTKAAVAKGGVRLILDNGAKILSTFCHHLLGHVLEAKVDGRVL